MKTSVKLSMEVLSTLTPSPPLSGTSLSSKTPGRVLVDRTIYVFCKVQDILDGVQDFLDPVQVFLDRGSKISWTGVQDFLDGVQEILDRVFQKCA